MAMQKKDDPLQEVTGMAPNPAELASKTLPGMGSGSSVDPMASLPGMAKDAGASAGQGGSGPMPGMGSGSGAEVGPKPGKGSGSGAEAGPKPGQSQMQQAMFKLKDTLNEAVGALSSSLIQGGESMPGKGSSPMPGMGSGPMPGQGGGAIPGLGGDLMPGKGSGPKPGKGSGSGADPVASLPGMAKDAGASAGQVKEAAGQVGQVARMGAQLGALDPTGSLSATASSVAVAAELTGKAAEHMESAASKAGELIDAMPSCANDAMSFATQQLGKAAETAASTLPQPEPSAGGPQPEQEFSIPGMSP